MITSLQKPVINRSKVIFECRTSLLPGQSRDGQVCRPRRGHSKHQHPRRSDLDAADRLRAPPLFLLYSVERRPSGVDVAVFTSVICHRQPSRRMSSGSGRLRTFGLRKGSEGKALEPGIGGGNGRQNLDLCRATCLYSRVFRLKCVDTGCSTKFRVAEWISLPKTV